jgi:hypothetical protein
MLHMRILNKVLDLLWSTLLVLCLKVHNFGETVINWLIFLFKRLKHLKDQGHAWN